MILRKSTRSSLLRDNILAMALVHISNLAIPLLTLPLLTRSFGAEIFGKIIFVQIITNYAVILVDYGFTFSATRMLSINRNNNEKISHIFMSNWVAQWTILFAISSIIFIFLLTIDKFPTDIELYVVSFIQVIATVLFPIWFFNGLESMRLVAIIQIVSRLLSLVLILLFINGPEDSVLYLAILGLSGVLSGFISLLIIRKMFILKFERPQWRDVSNALMQGWATFVLKGSISLYTLFIPLTLGWLAGPTALAQFNLADKLRVASQSLLTPISQAIFPRLSHLFSNEPGRARAFLSKITLWFLVIGFFLSLGMFFAAELLVAIFGGSEFEQSVGLLRIMSFCPLLVAVSNIYGAQVLLAAGKQKVVVLTTILCAGSVLLVTGSVVTSFGGQGAASIVVVVEAIVAVVYLIAGKKLLYRSQIA